MKTVASIMKPFSKMVTKLENIVEAQKIQISACTSKIEDLKDQNIAAVAEIGLAHKAIRSINAVWFA